MGRRCKGRSEGRGLGQRREGEEIKGGGEEKGVRERRGRMRRGRRDRQGRWVGQEVDGKG